MKYLIILIFLIFLIFLISCAPAKNKRGLLFSPIESWSFRPVFTNVVEISVIENNNLLDYYYDYKMNGNLTYEKRSPDFLVLEKRNLVPKDHRFVYIQKTDLGLLMFYQGNNGIFAKYSLDDGITWNKSNNGKPILSVGLGWYKNIWNMAFAEDDKGHLHALVECAKNGDQSDVALCYGRINFRDISLIDFNNVMLRNPVIHGAGNPWMRFSKSTGKILTVYGAINRKDSPYGQHFWHLRASLGSGKKWKESKTFLAGIDNIHIADPHLVEINDSLMIYYSTDQVYLDVIYKKMSINGFVNNYFN